MSQHEQEKEMQKQKRKPILLYWLLAILVSILFHFLVLYDLSHKSIENPLEKNALPQGYIKLDVSDKKEFTQKKETEEEKRILEAPLTPTEPPPDAEFFGQNDHTAKKRMKVKDQNQPKALDPGLARPQENATQTPMEKQRAQEKEIEKETEDLKTPVSENGILPLTKKQKDARKDYENFLSKSTKDIANAQIKQGYMDHLNDAVEEGETIDMNTKEYRFIGYFTGLRKAIELVWVYPNEAAQRGLQGRVLVKFIIMRDGKVSKAQVLESSGYKILDDTIIQAIRLAAPFSPLPNNFNKDHLIVRGSFHYVLGNY